jgi:hypothetical protein
VTTTTAQPERVYGDAENVVLRIGNGGAGQAGLVEVLSNAYISSHSGSGKPGLGVAWYKSDTPRRPSRTSRTAPSEWA